MCCDNCNDCDSCGKEEPTPATTIRFLEAEVHKLSLRPGDVVVMTFRTDEIESDQIDALRNGFRKLLPDNKVVLMVLPTDADLKITQIDAADMKAEAEDIQPQKETQDDNSGTEGQA